MKHTINEKNLFIQTTAPIHRDDRSFYSKGVLLLSVRCTPRAVPLYTVAFEESFLLDNVCVGIDQ
ncbi:MAG: hypothetical protein ACK5JU_05875 [Bacteroidales bacterium]